MPPPTTKDAKQALYAVAGVADLAVSTIRHLPAEAAKLRDRLPDEAVKTYGQLVRRGETLVTGVRRSRPTRQATEATRNAVSRTKAANTQRNAPGPGPRPRRPAPPSAGPPPPTPRRPRRGQQGRRR